MIYLDQASTYYPLSPEVVKAFHHFYRDCPGASARSSHPEVLRYATYTELLRDALLEMINAPEEGTLVFTAGATMSLNTVIRGMGLRQDEILMSPLEHAAVSQSVASLPGQHKPHILPASKDGSIDLYRLEEELKGGSYSAVRLVIINAMSNVNGLIQELHPISHLLKHYQPELKILLDASQSIPQRLPDVEKDLLDFVVITAHKGLAGPLGLGALFLREPELVSPLCYGGTGSLGLGTGSASSAIERFEVGTPNTAALFAFYVALQQSQAVTLTSSLWLDFLDRLSTIQGLSLLRATHPAQQGFVCSILSSRYTPGELADLLWGKYRIVCRAGLHCAPLAQQYLGTAKTGTLRLSAAAHTRVEDLDRTYQALYELHR